MQKDQEETTRRTVSRRVAMRGVGLAGLSLAALGVGAACGGDDESAPASPAASGQRVQTFTIELGEGEVLEEVNGKDEVVGEYHRWAPNMLVAFKGDKVVLQVKNPRKNVHSLEIPAFSVNTGKLEPRTGVATVEFTADKAGVFMFGCGSDFDEAKKSCDPDHKAMIGHLMVLNA